MRRAHPHEMLVVGDANARHGTSTRSLKPPVDSAKAGPVISRPPGNGGSFGKAGQPMATAATAAAVSRRHATPVIDDLDRAAVEHDAHASSPRMVDDVGDAFTHRPAGGRRRQPARRRQRAAS